MVPDRQKVRTDGMDGRTDDAKTISLRLCWGIIRWEVYQAMITMCIDVKV